MSRGVVPSIPTAAATDRERVETERERERDQFGCHGWNVGTRRLGHDRSIIGAATTSSPNITPHTEKGSGEVTIIRRALVASGVHENIRGGVGSNRMYRTLTHPPTDPLPGGN